MSTALSTGGGIKTAYGGTMTHPPDTPEPAVWLSVSEAARYVRCHENTIRRWIASGRLPATRNGPRKIEVLRSDLDALRQPIRAPGLAVAPDTTTTTTHHRERFSA
jgi:excisionase family DNA binding protein